MAEHRFHIGDLVRVQDPASPKPADAFVDAILRSSMLGIYEVTSLLPDARGEPQYRLKGIAGWLERAVRESQMAPAASLGLRAGSAAQMNR